MQQYSGIDFIPAYLPPKRAEKALIEGRVDFDFICLEWMKNAEPGEGFVTSAPLFEITE